jgi:hypothetical protein
MEDYGAGAGAAGVDGGQSGGLLGHRYLFVASRWLRLCHNMEIVFPTSGIADKDFQ